MPVERDRGEKDVDALVSRLDPYAAKSRSFVKFCDCRAYSELPELTTDMKDTVVKYLPVIMAADTKSLDVKVAEAAMKLLMDKFERKYKFDLEPKKEFPAVMGARLRNLLHVWHIAVKNKAAWALKAQEEFSEKDALPESSQATPPAEDEQPEEKKAETKEQKKKKKENDTLTAK